MAETSESGSNWSYLKNKVTLVPQPLWSYNNYCFDNKHLVTAVVGITSGRMTRLEGLHKTREFLNTRPGHGIVDAGTTTPHTAMTLEVNQLLQNGFFKKLTFEIRRG